MSEENLITFLGLLFTSVFQYIFLKGVPDPMDKLHLLFIVVGTNP